MLKLVDCGRLLKINKNIDLDILKFNNLFKSLMCNSSMYTIKFSEFTVK